jgi:hypothetical protein
MSTFSSAKALIKASPPDVIIFAIILKKFEEISQGSEF